MVNKQFIAQNRPAEKPAADMSVSLSGLRLDNPVVPASGTFGYGNEFRDFYDINILGSFSFKGTTRDARFGNPTPRIAECTAGMINAVGLQNPGIDAVIAEELPRLKTFFHKPVIANISGFSVEEYAYCCERIDREPQVGIIEVNVSCPNVRHGGMSFGTSPECAAEVTRAVKAVTTKPVYIKLSPNVTDIVSIARACEEAGADGICLINTLLGMRIDVRKPQGGHRQYDGRLFGCRSLPRGRADGLPGRQGLQNTRHGVRRRDDGPRRDRDDDGRRHGRTGRRREPGEPLCLEGDRRGAACRDATARDRAAERHNRNCRMNVKPYDMQHDVIIACDFKSAEDTFEFLDLFRGEARKPFLKIGMELFYAEGPEIVREIKRRGHKIFLDLKLHDIPNTVKKAMAVLSRLDVDMCNVHAAGTIEMMKYALEGLTREDGTRPLLIAVTQLTSTSEERMQQELLIASSIGDTIVKYAQNTKAAGLDGVVCSPLEAGMVHQACGKEFLTITPGVRFADGDVADQVRVTTPARAREIGSDFIVVGRPITAAADPVAAYRRCVDEFCG